MPDHPVTAMLLAELGEPMMSSTLLLPGEELPRTDAKEIYERLEHSVDLVLDGGNCGLVPTSVIDLSGDRAVVVRVGPRRGQPLCGRGNRIMAVRCGRQSSCSTINNECKHWIYLILSIISPKISIWAIPVLFAITLHEVAHGWTARYFGDRTAEMLGRLSLNPLRHIDPVGTVLVPGCCSRSARR